MKKLIIKSELMSKWDIRFCKLAKYVSKWSKDPKAKVGAVIMSKKGGDISIGYNGFPMGVEDSVDRLSDKEKKLELVVHAEMNALLAAGSRANGSTLYVWGKPVCARCAGSIIQAGVKHVIAPNPSAEDDDSNWKGLGETATQMFYEAGLKITFYTKDSKGYHTTRII